MWGLRSKKSDCLRARTGLYIFLGLFILELSYANSILFKQLQLDGIPENVGPHFSEYQHRAKDGTISEAAVRRYILQHYRREHEGLPKTFDDQKNESDLIKPCEKSVDDNKDENKLRKHSDDDVDDEKNRPEKNYYGWMEYENKLRKKSDDDLDNEINRPERNYYGWIDFRKRSTDHDDYLY